ncbi:hypothetical protein C3L33_05769, partial [Rhododendron williamsianum]
MGSFPGTLPDPFDYPESEPMSGGSALFFTPRKLPSKKAFEGLPVKVIMALGDYLGYAKPSRLLVATEPEICTDSSLEKKSERLKCWNTALFDDENGDSILQRIPASLIKENSNQSEAEVVSDVLHFQRGYVDEFAFEGPKLQKIESLWVGIESGQWRICGINLITTSCCQSTLEENGGKEAPYIGFEYKFEVEDTLLGEGSDLSMVELRPCLITEFSGDNLALVNKYLAEPNSVATDVISKEESMREYADLKFSLLFYDTLLVLSGSSIAAFSAGENAAFGFLTGGIIGFLYLLLLQRSVDGLPAPGSNSVDKKGKFDQLLGRIKGPVSSLVLAFIFAVIAVKYGSEDGAVDLTPKELMFGMLGFLSCKVAVVLAAFKPVPMGLGDNK